MATITQDTTCCSGEKRGKLVNFYVKHRDGVHNNWKHLKP